MRGSKLCLQVVVRDKEDMDAKWDKVLLLSRLGEPKKVTSTPWLHAAAGSNWQDMGKPMKDKWRHLQGPCDCQLYMHRRWIPCPCLHRRAYPQHLSMSQQTG